MQILTTTPIAVLICLAILWVGPSRGIIFLFLVMPLGTAAAVNIGGLGSIMLTDAAVMTIWLAMILRWRRVANLLGTLNPGQPGFPLFLLLIVATLGALFLPRVNAGVTDVYIIARRDGVAEHLLTPLRPVGSNIGQLFRLTISASVFVLLATVFRRVGDAHVVLKAILFATYFHIVLSIADLLSPVFGRDILAFLRTAFFAVLDNQIVSGIRRLIGAFPEPSSFAYYTIGLFGFWTRYWFGARHSRVAALMMLLMGALLLRSTSSAGWLGLAAFLTTFLIWHVRKTMQSQRAAFLYVCLAAAMPALCAMMIFSYSFLPVVPEIFDRLLFTKLETSSGVERMAWNRQAVQNFIDTYGMGAGLGSVRGSGWLFVTFANLGIIGASLFIWFVIAVLKMRPPQSAHDSHDALVAASLQWACAAIVFQACLTKSFPNLETPFFAMAGLAVGLLRHLVLHDPANTLPVFVSHRRHALPKEFGEKA